MHDRPHLKSLKDWIKQVLFGMCMGAADLVPGISGGTMALILGIYEDLIFSINSLGTGDALSILSLQFRRFNKKVSWDFLLGLLAGAALSFALLSQFIQTWLSNPVSTKYLYGVFSGMIIASAMICYARVKSWNRYHLAIFILGAVITYQATGYRVEPVLDGPRFHVHVPSETFGDISEKEIRNYDKEEEMLLNVSQSNLSAMLAKDTIGPETKVYNIDSSSTGTASEFVSPSAKSWLNPWLIMCGAIAVSAMLLPGVSGSYLLTVLGAYAIAIGALADFFREGDVDSFLILCNLGIGIVVGALVFSKVIAFLLEHSHDGTLAMLLGFMVGALHTVWPFFTYEYVIDPLKLSKGPEIIITGAYTPSIFNPELYTGVLIMFAGYLIVLALETISRKKFPFPMK